MVVVDRLTKMAHFIPTCTDVSAVDVADLFYHHVWCKHGLSLDIVSDRDTKFTGEVWNRLTELWPRTKSMSSAFHPQTDGQTDRRFAHPRAHLSSAKCRRARGCRRESVLLLQLLTTPLPPVSVNVRASRGWSRSSRWVVTRPVMEWSRVSHAAGHAAAREVVD